jgi:hypothetical protein
MKPRQYLLPFNPARYYVSAVSKYENQNYGTIILLTDFVRAELYYFNKRTSTKFICEEVADENICPRKGLSCSRFITCVHLQKVRRIKTRKMR